MAVNGTSPGRTPWSNAAAREARGEGGSAFHGAGRCAGNSDIDVRIRCGAFGVLLPSLCLLLLPGCTRPCEGYFVGESDADHLVAQDWPYGSGGAAGVWEVTLFPAAYGTNCVDVDAGDYPAEHYAYTLEFVEGQAGEQTNIYVDGVLFATGTYADESADGVPDRLEYVTGVRVADDRPGGTLTYIITGTADLEPNKAAGSLTWYGDEYITVQDSRDPEVSPDCTFRYEVTGYKVCDE